MKKLYPYASLLPLKNWLVGLPSFGYHLRDLTSAAQKPVPKQNTYNGSLGAVNVCIIGLPMFRVNTGT